MQSPTIPADVLTRWQEAKGNASKSFDLLKEYILAGGDVQAMSLTVKQSHETDSYRDRNYTWVTKLELGMRYGASEDAKAFIEELIEGAQLVPTCEL